LRGKRLLAAGAAATAAALANGADASTGVTGRQVAAGQVPRYYMALPGADNFANVPGAPTAVLADTFTGKKLLTVRPSGKDKFVTVSAAADDRTFVLGAAPGLEPPAVPSATTWYLVRVRPGRVFTATVRKLRVPAPPTGGRADTTALSPDGRELAVLGTEPGPKQSYLEFLRVYSVATGRLLRAWSGPLDVAWDAYTTLSWTAGGRQLAVGYTWFAKSAQYLGVRTVDVTRPGQSLLADSRLAWSVKDYLNFPNTFLEYSAVSGKLARTVYRTDSSCVPGGSGVLWASASGRTLIGYIEYGEPPLTTTSVLRFGIFTGGRFTPLPVPPTTSTVPDAIAW
jgi:hypothetical protein